MRLLFFSDVHLAERPPISRTPTYADDLFRKLAEVKEIAATCDVSIFGGDLLHTPSVPHGLVRRIISFFRDWPCPLYIVVGNHDLPADGMAGLGRVALGVVLEALAVDKAYVGPRVQLLTDVTLRKTKGEDIRIRLSAGHWTPSIDGDVSALMMGHLESTPDAADLDCKIKIVHALVMATGKEHPFKCVAANEIETDADVLLVGHPHWQTGPCRTKNGKLVVGPGSIARTQASESERRRQVQVAVLTLSKDAPVVVEMIPLTSAKPSGEVFADAVEDRGEARDERFSGYVAVLETGLGIGDGVEEALAVLEKRAPVGVAEMTRQYLRDAGL